MSPTRELISQIYFKINGTPASAEMMREVREILVDTSMYLPDMFAIQLDDPDLSWMDNSLLDIGKEVEITGKSVNGTTKLLTKAEIVAIEPEFDQVIGTTVTIRGYDKTHRLCRGKENRAFQQMTDSDIVKKIASERGLKVNIDSTSTVYEHVFQNNQTDMEFIQERAWRNGYQAYVENGTLYFKKASSNESSGVTLEWGKNLNRFQARFSAAGQVSQAEIHGWDVKQKKAIVSVKSSPEGTPVVNSKTHGGSIANSAFGSSPPLFESQAVSTSAEADALAQANLNESCQRFFQAEGICEGEPAIRAGKQVEIKGIGTRFSGKYTITRAVHRYDLSGYTTEFEISGHRAKTLPQLLSGRDNPPAFGVVVGIVTNSEDPDGMARVKVKYPTIDEKLESSWARLATPMAGPGRGIEFIPEVNDEVLVAFEHNDFNRPYIVGSLWNGKDKPPEGAVQSGKVEKRIIKSRSGHIITLNDKAGEESISIIDKDGQKTIIDSANKKIEIMDKNNNKIVMTPQSIAIESAKDMTIKAKGKLQIEAATGINVKSNTKLQMEGMSGVDVKSTGPTNIKGLTASLQGDTTAELKGSAMVTVQGGIVKIN